MAKKFEIIGSSLVITDTITGVKQHAFPKEDVYHSQKDLNVGFISLYDTSGVNSGASRVDVRVAIADAVDGTDTPFTKETFETFSFDNLGFKTGGGSGTGTAFNYAYIKDIKPNGTSGGSFISGAWRTRDLNNLDTNIAGLTLVSNQFTLPAGSYDILANVPFFSVNRAQSKLRNITDGTDQLIGSQSFSYDNSLGINESFIRGFFTISEPKTFEIQNRCEQTKTGNGLGVDGNFGAVEIFTQVKLIKIN
jgi:hypothetical protein